MKVYKYMSTHTYNKDNQKINLLKCIFEDKTLWFSNPLNFNDPFELKPNIKEISNDEKHLLIDMVSSHLNATNQVHQFYYHAIRPILDNVGVLSLSSNKDNLPMWAHYANNHKGIVLEFEKNHWFFNKLKLPKDFEVLHQLKKVKYIPKESRKSINSNKYFSNETFLTKSEDWAYEDEYRMSVYAETNDEYLDGINIHFPNDLLTSVYLGSKIENETVDYILKMKKKDEWKHLNIFKMEIDKIAYKLIPKKLL